MLSSWPYDLLFALSKVAAFMLHEAVRRRRFGRSTLSVAFLALALVVASCSVAGAGGEARSAGETLPGSPATTGEDGGGGEADESGSATTATPSAEGGFVLGAVDWAPCGGGECGSLTVPIDHDDPTGPTIDIAMARVLAIGSPNERIGSLFVNFGGPGGEGTEQIVDFAPFFPTEIQQRFDIVSFDPRGVEDSAGLGCDAEIGDEPTYLIDPSDGFEDDVVDGLATWERVMACVAQSPIIDDLGTVAVARDLDLMRQAVGDEDLNLVGFSYGTQLGWVYATLFPENTRALVLDGAVAPNDWGDEGTLTQLAAIEAAARRLDQGCSEVPTCALGEEGLLNTINRLVAELEANPIELDNGETYGPSDLLSSTIQTTYVNPELVGSFFSQAVAALADGNVAPLLSYDDLFSGGFEETLFWSVICADGGGSADDASIADVLEAAYELSPTFGAIPGAIYCDRFPGEIDGVPELDTSGSEPILVIGSTGDNATPYGNAVELDGLLADSVLLSFDGPGHTVFTSDPCIDGYVTDYVVTGTMPPAGTRCGDPTGGAPDDWLVPIPQDG